jgi:hypothetical protein
VSDETTWAVVGRTWRMAWHSLRDALSLKLIYWALCVASPSVSTRTLDLFVELGRSFLEDSTSE